MSVISTSMKISSCQKVDHLGAKIAKYKAWLQAKSAALVVRRAVVASAPPFDTPPVSP
jgi:hypothetical protein